MESKIKSKLNKNIFTPSKSEFENFADYIAKLERQNISFAKVSLTSIYSLFVRFDFV